MVGILFLLFVLFILFVLFAMFLSTLSWVILISLCGLSISCRWDTDCSLWKSTHNNNIQTKSPCRCLNMTCICIECIFHQDCEAVGRRNRRECNCINAHCICDTLHIPHSSRNWETSENNQLYMLAVLGVIMLIVLIPCLCALCSMCYVDIVKRSSRSKGVNPRWREMCDDFNESSEMTLESILDWDI